MPHIRGQRVDWGFIAVQADGKPLTILKPEVAIEGCFESGRLAAIPLAELILSCFMGKMSAGQVRAVDVGLDFTKRNRCLGDPSIGVAHPVPAVLPALIGHASVRSSVVLDV